MLEDSLAPDVLRILRRGDELYVGVLAAGGYEFAVAMIAALAAGAAVVPMSTYRAGRLESQYLELIWIGVANPAEEVQYFVNKSQQIAILSSATASSLARSVAGLCAQQGRSLPHLVASEAIGRSTYLKPFSVVISSDRYLDDNAAGVVIFTSGTTGKPKGSVLRRAYIHEAALNVVEGYDITHNDILLHTLPVHHATGLGTSFFPWMISGACIEFRTHGSFDPAWVWRRLRDGEITVFSGVPTMYLRLMWYHQKELAGLPASERYKYAAGVQRLRCLLCGSSALQQPVQDFWTRLRNNGKPGIYVRYGSSEVPGCIRVSADTDFLNLPEGCVGSPTTGVDIEIDSEGELLIKSPLMFSGYVIAVSSSNSSFLPFPAYITFSRYLFDEEATIAAHDEQVGSRLETSVVVKASISSLSTELR